MEAYDDQLVDQYDYNHTLVPYQPVPPRKRGIGHQHNLFLRIVCFKKTKAMQPRASRTSTWTDRGTHQHLRRRRPRFHTKYEPLLFPCHLATASNYTSSVKWAHSMPSWRSSLRKRPWMQSECSSPKSCTLCFSCMRALHNMVHTWL